MKSHTRVVVWLTPCASGARSEGAAVLGYSLSKCGSGHTPFSLCERIERDPTATQLNLALEGLAQALR